MGDTSVLWLRCLPPALRARFEHRPNLHKAILNTGWLFCDRILRLSLGVVVAVWLARYLGPQQFGLLNYAMAIVALFAVLASCGLNGIVVRDLIDDPQGERVTLGSAFALQMAAGVVAAALAAFFICVARPHDDVAQLIVMVLALAFVFKASDVVKYWFEARLESRRNAWIESACFLLIAAVKIGLIIANAPLIAFAWAMLAESVLIALGLLAAYLWRSERRTTWRIDMTRTAALLRESRPLVLSALALMLYMRIDQIMVAHILGDAAAGVYSAAVRISEAWYFVPVAIVASVFPSIIEAKKKSEALYDARLQRLYALLVVIAVLVAIPMQFVSQPLIVALFGDSYREAGQVLPVAIWSGVFVALSVSSGRWMVNEGYGWLALRRNLIGVAVNVCLNYVFIPRFGIVGAAYSTLIALAFSAYLSDAFSTRTRATFMQKTRALLLLELLPIRAGR